MPEVVTLLVIVAGVFGSFIGSFLNRAADRVPAKVFRLRESQCTTCDSPSPPWQNVPVLSWIAHRGKCASCGSPISARYPLVEAITGIAFAVVAWWFLVNADAGAGNAAQAWALGVVMVAFLYFAGISIVLTLIDLDAHRLPNNIVLPSFAVAGVLFTLAALLSADWAALLRAGTGAAALYVFYSVLRFASPGGMGGGDVKLAGVIGIYLGWIGFDALVVGAFMAFVYGGVFGIALLVLGKAGRKTAIPFGPWMILGGWTGVFAGESVGHWYVNLFIGA